MFGIGFPELILILVIALIIFGPGKLPEVGKAIGKSVREFKKATNEIKQEFEIDETQKSQVVPPPSTQETSAQTEAQPDNTSKTETQKSPANTNPYTTVYDEKKEEKES